MSIGQSISIEFDSHFLNIEQSTPNTPSPHTTTTIGIESIDRIARQRI
ncbi:hypothetical protein EVA_21852 [gut metagenome]|uniref:Uncharacterized protein n=1 Tax=gut metagenome TaxID=749906 RepID=J9F590_9ZZZZ